MRINSCQDKENWTSNIEKEMRNKKKQEFIKVNKQRRKIQIKVYFR